MMSGFHEPLRMLWIPVWSPVVCWIEISKNVSCLFIVHLQRNECEIKGNKKYFRDYFQFSNALEWVKFNVEKARVCSVYLLWRYMKGICQKLMLSENLVLNEDASLKTEWKWCHILSINDMIWLQNELREMVINYSSICFYFIYIYIILLFFL